MTPAQRLTAAADTIERTADGLVPWYTADELEWMGDAGAHVALWDPSTARLAATLLRTLAGYATDAEHLGLTVDHGPLTTAALNLADTINMRVRA